MSFTYRLEHDDRSSAEPEMFTTAVPTWNPGDTIPLGKGRTLRVIDTRPGREPGGDTVLVVDGGQCPPVVGGA
jgi:hypothetical protein